MKNIEKTSEKGTQKFIAIRLGINGSGKLKNGACMFLPHNSTLGYLPKKIVHKGKKYPSGWSVITLFTINQLSMVRK